MNGVPGTVAPVLLVLALLATACSAYAADTGYRSPFHIDGATTVSVDEARRLFDKDAVFIDVRNPCFLPNVMFRVRITST